MALKWFRKNKDKKDKQNKVEPESDAQSADSKQIEDQQTDAPDPSETEKQETGATPEPIDKPETMIIPHKEAAAQEEDQELGLEPEEAAETAVEAAPAKKEKTGYFQRLRERLFKSRKSLSTGFDSIFTGKTKIDDDILEELEEHLITSDIGVQTTIDLIQKISKAKAKDASQVKSVLKDEILSILTTQTDAPAITYGKPHVVLVVGVNGVGKTTTIGKLAASANAAGKKVLIAAADTFRAAAVEQLGIWAERANAEFVKHKENADPAAVAFDAVAAATARGCDLVLIDTAGRLHTKVNLMEELKKIKRTVAKQMEGAPHETLLVLDATTGQNALSQATLFNDALEISGLVLTKLDGTAKGGIVIGICSALNIPLQYIGIGEQIEDLRPFDAQQFIDALF
jgi:fused signal recognition particle receptor